MWISTRIKTGNCATVRTVSDALNISGQVVRRLRAEKGWSQPDLARRCQLAGWDVSRDIIARIEGATRLVRDMELVKLAAVFGVTPNDLVGVKKTPPSGDGAR